MEIWNDLSRRDAVKLAGAVTATVAAAQLGAPAIVSAAGDQVRFGLIGTGSLGDCRDESR